MLGKGWLGQHMGVQKVVEMKWGMAKRWTEAEEWTRTLLCNIPDFVYSAPVGRGSPKDTDYGQILSAAFSSSIALLLSLHGQNLFHCHFSYSRENFMSTISFTFSSANLVLQLISAILNTASMGRKSWKYLVCKWWLWLFALMYLR